MAQEFIKNNLDKIQTMYSSFIMISPKCAIEAFDRGIKIDLLTEHWWDVSLYALQELNKIDVKKTGVHRGKIRLQSTYRIHCRGKTGFGLADV